jgi:hypothetical protein
MSLARRSLPLLLLILAEAAWAGQEQQAVERRVYVCPCPFWPKRMPPEEKNK